MSEDNTEAKAQQTVDEKIVSLKINLPKAEHALEIPCSIDDTLFEIIETLKVLPSTREFTAFELRQGSVKLGDETPISELVSENEDSVSISLVASPYNEITARKHVIEARKYAGLETAHDSFAEITGVCAGCSTFGDLDLKDAPESEKETGDSTADDKEEEAENFKVTDEEKTELASMVSNLSEIKADINAVVAKPNVKALPALKSLYISQWSPADNLRKLAGDLFYLQAQTLEGENLNITAHVSGFFVNNSSNTKFNGSMNTSKKERSSFDYSLISLLKSLSPAFEKQIKENEEKLSKYAVETYIVPNTTTVTSPWLIGELETPSPDLGRSQYNLLHGGIDGADLKVNWNNDYQLLKDIPRETLAQRYNREQSLISSSSDFTTAAIKGAMSIIRGEIEPVNPDEDPNYYIYLRNGIFYSKAIDSINQFESTGGAEAARYAVAKDIAALKYLNRYDVAGVHSLLTTVVDYLGHRIVCQAPVPGLFSDNDAVIEDETEEPKEAEQPVKYGFIDDHSDVASDESFAKKFSEVGEAFHIKPHKIWNKDGSKIVDVVTSGYTKGTLGTDDRSYIIDMFRSTPLDIEFIEANYDPSKETSYPHGETLLRHEAISEWIKRETAVAVKKETERLEKEGKVNGENKPTIGIDDSLFLLNPDAFSLSAAPNAELAKELKQDEDKVREVSKFVSQILVPEFIKDMEKSEVYNAIDGTHLSKILHESGINIRYLGKIAELALERKASYLKEQETKLAEIAKSNLEIEEQEAKELAEKKAKLEAKLQARREAMEKGEKVPDLKKELEEEEEAEKQKEKAESELPTNLNTIPVAVLLTSLYEVSVNEMIARATKHFLRKQLESIPLPLTPYVISHVHNCLLASKSNPTPESPKLDTLLAGIYKDVDLSILEKDSEFVLNEIAKGVFIRYRFTLPENWVESIKTLQLLRSIALKFGIQWKNREYAFTKEQLDAQVAKQTAAVERSLAAAKNEEKHSRKNKKSASSVPELVDTAVISTTFTPEDIVCIAPIVKNSIFESTSIPDAWEAGMLKLSSKNEEENQEGSIFANQTIQFCERLYGPVHNITASYLTKLGNLYGASNDSADSVLLLKKAFQIFERCAGIDSFQASLALNQLANAYLGGNQIVNAVKIYMKLLNNWILAFDQYHPNVINILTSIAVILMRLGMNNDAIKVFTKTLELSDKVNGEISQQSGFFRYHLAQLYLAEKKFTDAIEYADKAFDAYKATLGLKDRSTIEVKRLSFGLKNYVEYVKHQDKNLQAKEQEARKLEQQQHIKQKLAQKSRQVTPNPEIANKSIDDIMAFIGGSNSDGKKKKKNSNKKKNSKK